MIAALLYAKFAPLHSARLAMAGAHGERSDHRLIGIEVADTQGDYRWPRMPLQSANMARYTLFPGRDYWTLSYASVRKALHRALDEIAPDVVVLPGWAFKESLAGMGWCLRRGIPRVVISDSQPIDRARNPVNLWLKRLLVQRFQAAFVGGARHVRYMADLGLPLARCFPGCDVVDNEFFAKESQVPRERKQARTGRPVLLSCLRLLPRKNILGVLDVLANQATQWTWTIAGDGPQRSQIERRISALSLQERVHLLGHVDYFELPPLYAQADAYLQPSLSDPWALAVNEAMACGLPVVVSNRCGCQDDLVKEDVNGFSFDPIGIEGLAHALQCLLASRNRWRDMGQASQEIIAKWGLALFARNLWLACETALRPIPESLKARAISRTLSLAL